MVQTKVLRVWVMVYQLPNLLSSATLDHLPSGQGYPFTLLYCVPCCLYAYSSHNLQGVWSLCSKANQSSVSMPHVGPPLLRSYLVGDMQWELLINVQCLKEAPSISAVNKVPWSVLCTWGTPWCFYTCPRWSWTRPELLLLCVWE